MRYDAFLSYSHAADGKLAPALQRALHRFARPWNRMRALRVFRDTTSLAATPELWPTIVAALGQSSHFLLLASPRAAASKWVQREVQWWFANRPAGKLFVLLTAGTIAWDEDTRDFDWKLTTALPDLVRGKFQSEPLYVDLTWADDQDHLSLQNTRFRQAILDIAAPLHGKDKDQLDGEDVHQFRRTRRLRAAAMAGLGALALATTTAAVVAVKERNLAIAQARIALSRQLAAEALAGDTRLDVAILLAAAANRLSETPQARAALQRLLMRTPTVSGVLASDRPEQRLAFSPDGRLLASAPGNFADLDDQVVYIWSIDALQLVGELRPAEKHGKAQAIAFHPDGKTLAVGYFDGAIVLWDVARREPTGAPLKAGLSTDSLAFSPDGRHLLSASSSSDRVMMWDTTHRQLAPNRMPQFKSFVREVVFSPDGATAAAVTSDHDVVVWDIKSGQLVSAPRSVGGERVTAFAFHPDGRSWLLGTSKGVTLYDAKTQKVRRDLGHAVPMRSEPSTLRVNANGNTIVISGGAPQVFDPAQDQDLNVQEVSGSEIVTPVRYGSDSAFALSPDGRLFAQSLPDGAIVLWNFRQRRSLGEEFDVEKPPDDKLTALLGPGKIETPDFVLWDTARRRPVGEVIRTEHGDITALAFSPNKPIAVTGGRDGSIVFWDIETRRPDGEPLQSSGAIEDLTFSPDGKLLASRIRDTGLIRVTLWDVARRQAINQPFGDRAGSETLGFSPDGRFLMSAGDGKILLYDVAQRNLEAELTHGEGLVDRRAGAAFSIDGRQVFSLSKTSLVTWDIATRRRIDKLVRMPAATVDMVARLSPDGKLLALLSNDGLRLFDAATRQPLGEVFASKGSITLPEHRHVGFSPDGKQFVVGGVFSPDGKWLASRAISSPFIWHIDIERWLARACELVNRNLTAVEWRRYTGSDDSYVRACPVFPGASAR
jgi:WD40 repeat protein